jgi:hypothetical protein
MTMTKEQNFLRTRAEVAMPAGLFPRVGVVGEVKPHTSNGIASGVVQLRTRLRRLPEVRRAQVRPQLITYRPSDRADGAYEVLAPDSLQLRTWVATGRRPPGLRWYSLGTFPFARSLERIRVRDCPALLGSEIEPQVRDHYARRLGIPPLGIKTAAQHGADIEHELVAFLRELASELSAELAGY